MIEAWFSVTWCWIPGGVLGLSGALLGTMAGILVPRGQRRGLVMGFILSVCVLSAVLLVAGITAFSWGQPYHVWYGLGFPGLLGLFIMGIMMWVFRRAYLAAELRKSMAEDIDVGR